MCFLLPCQKILVCLQVGRVQGTHLIQTTGNFYSPVSSVAEGAHCSLASLPLWRKWQQDYWCICLRDARIGNGYTGIISTTLSILNVIGIDMYLLWHMQRGNPAIAFVKLCAKTATVWHCDRSVSEVAYIVKTSMSSKNYNYTAG